MPRCPAWPPRVRERSVPPPSCLLGHGRPRACMPLLAAAAHAAIAAAAVERAASLPLWSALPHALPCSCSQPRAGEDKRVHMWELGSWKPFAKAQPLQKAVCHSIGWAPWGGTGLGLHPSLLLATGARAAAGAVPRPPAKPGCLPGHAASAAHNCLRCAGAWLATPAAAQPACAAAGEAPLGLGWAQAPH